MMNHIVAMQGLWGSAWADCEDDGIVELGMTGADLEILAKIVLCGAGEHVFADGLVGLIADDLIHEYFGLFGKPIDSACLARKEITFPWFVGVEEGLNVFLDKSKVASRYGILDNTATCFNKGGDNLVWSNRCILKDLDLGQRSF